MSNETLTINLDIEEAIQHGNLTVHYQPIFDIRTVNSAPVELEALIRWDHPRLGLLSPTEFDIWLTSGQIMTQLTDYVLQRVMEQQSVWKKQNINLPVAINLPIANINDCKFPQRLTGFLNQFNIDHASLMLELGSHSSGIFSKSEMQIMNRLAQDGFPIILDSFGQNPVLLSNLSQLSLAGLKIDAGLISGIAENKAAQQLVRGIVHLAHDLNFLAYAKNVELQEDLSILKALGCDRAQGWYFSKPMPSSEVIRLLAVQTHAQPQAETASG